MKNKIEELVFLELTWKQFGEPSPKMGKIFSELTDIEKERYVKLSGKIHDVWNRISWRSPHVEGQNNTIVNSIKEYHENIEPLDEVILRISEDFGLTLKKEYHPDLRSFVTKNIGEDFWNKYFGD